VTGWRPRASPLASFDSAPACPDHASGRLPCHWGASPTIRPLTSGSLYQVLDWDVLRPLLDVNKNKNKNKNKSGHGHGLSTFLAIRRTAVLRSADSSLEEDE
jgi:hypothetical protein